jgi:hypothetical protein
MGANSDLSSLEIVTIAVFRLGGKTRPVDTEDIAHFANQLAPGKFCWRKYPEQINIEIVRTALSDAKKEKCGRFLTGTGNEGWMLTEEGAIFAKRHAKRLMDTKLTGERRTPSERRWRKRERERILASDAYLKLRENRTNELTDHEANSFFRIDEYVGPKSRERKIARLVNVFRDDPEIGPVVVELAKRIKAGVGNNEL